MEGNFDQDCPVIHVLSEPEIVQALIIYPSEGNGIYPSMRVEVHGCVFDPTGELCKGATQFLS